MKSQKKWTRWIVASAAVLAIGAATIAVYPQGTQAAMGVPGATQLWQRGGDFGHRGVKNVDHEALLADALGISTTDLQAAVGKATEAGLAQAVEKGLLTQAQADTLKSRGIQGRIPMLGMGRLGPTGTDGIDPQALLAEALGITTDQLQAAEQKAADAALAQAVTDGIITQEQADMMKARQALQPYLTARMQTAYTDALAQAVKDGVITQAQADQLLSESKQGFGRGFDFGHRGRGGHHGGMWGPGGRQVQPDTTTPQSSFPSAPQNSSNSNL